MASLEGADAFNGATGDKFPAVDIAGELNPGQNKNFEVDPTSSDISTSLRIKKQVEEAKKTKKKREEKDAMQKVKSAIIVSAVVAAVAGAVFVLTKKLREK